MKQNIAPNVADKVDNKAPWKTPNSIPENIERIVANGMEAETIIIYRMQKRLLHIAGYEEHISSISSFASRNFFRDNPSKA